MYDEVGFLGHHDPHHAMLGTSLGMGGGPSTIALPAFSDEAAAAAATAGLSLHGYLGFDSKQELGAHLLQAGNFQHCFHPSSMPDPSLLSIPSISFSYPNKRVVNLQAPANLFDDLSVDGSVSASLPSPFPPHMGLGTDHQTPLLRDVLHSVAPHDYGGFGAGGHVDPYSEGVEEDGCMADYAVNHPVFGIWKEMGGCGRADAKGGNTAEKQRRGQMSEKFSALRALIPNPTKADRASIISDAADYIKELLRTVGELRTLVQRKRCREDRSKRPRTGEEVPTDVDISTLKPAGDVDDLGRSAVGLLRSSWLQRKSKDTFVDVRIVEDEVNIKLTQRKKPGCLLTLAKVLQELELDLHHLASGNIGDYLIFMINTKIQEGSNVYASGIAKKLIEAMSMNHQPVF